MDLVIAFLGGVAGSLHCVGMCGGFPLALAARRAGASMPGASVASGRAERAPGAAVVRQLLYNAGRLNTLAFIGAICGGAGAAVVAIGPPKQLASALAMVAGGLMVAIGLEMLGFLSRVTARGAALVQATIGRWLAGVIASPSPMAPLALGVFNAFLPCQLIYAFAAQAGASASPVAGALTMLAFGMGTVPAMLALGLSRSLFSPRLRMRLSVLSGALVVGFGVLTFARGALDLEAVHRLLHHTGDEHVHREDQVGASARSSPGREGLSPGTDAADGISR